MKLISVKILGKDFRSLTANKLYEFNLNDREDRLSTKIFAGLNGSGKSNFLELFSEIFFYLETYHLSDKDDPKLKAPFGFEIEYILPIESMILGELGTFNFEEKDCHIRIVKPVNDLPEFIFKKYSEEKFIRLDGNTEFLLPSKIIGYTSGQNELLSNPYLKIKHRYFQAIETLRPDNSNDLHILNHLFFLDNSANFYIFISNMLLAEEKKLKYLKSILNLEDLNSFRITLNFTANKKKIQLRNWLLIQVNKLKLCATCWIERDGQLILDFKVNRATKDAFDFHFTDAFNLFKVFYELDILNLHLVNPKTREMILKSHKSLNISDEMPKADPSRLIFRIEKIKINKIIEAQKTVEIYYKGLSDGEHQFNEVVGTVLMIKDEGCLFLMDEPDTHFNPLWRAKMIEMLNYVSAASFDDKGKVKSVRNQEIIITTHSPFVISDSYNQDVYKFEKVNNIVQYENPKHIETYGASIGLLLQEIFNRRISISDYSNEDLEELRKAFLGLKEKETIKQKIRETKVRLLDFGESIEKFDLYNFLGELERETEAQG